ncbi:unnamed protein product [Chrysodeixis includens]|uniref:Uncharacterized protein n=1 Tax=Chrysodeixis includens TaxID=689277 RepID=A0A9N8KP84_CHRIL|nr:unnamed protein product [Chrysodeixis includens]
MRSWLTLSVQNSENRDKPRFRSATKGVFRVARAAEVPYTKADAAAEIDLSARRPQSSTRSPMCPCELEEPRERFSYPVQTPWISYDSSDDDDSIERSAAMTALKSSVYVASRESAYLEMSGDDFAGLVSDSEYSSDDDDMVVPESMLTNRASSSRMNVEVTLQEPDFGHKRAVGVIREDSRRAPD